MAIIMNVSSILPLLVGSILVSSLYDSLVPAFTTAGCLTLAALCLINEKRCREGITSTSSSSSTALPPSNVSPLPPLLCQPSYWMRLWGVGVSLVATSLGMMLLTRTLIGSESYFATPRYSTSVSAGGSSSESSSSFTASSSFSPNWDRRWGCVGGIVIMSAWICAALMWSDESGAVAPPSHNDLQSNEKSSKNVLLPANSPEMFRWSSASLRTLAASSLSSWEGGIAAALLSPLTARIAGTHSSPSAPFLFCHWAVWGVGVTYVVPFILANDRVDALEASSKISTDMKKEYFYTSRRLQRRAWAVMASFIAPALLIGLNPESAALLNNFFSPPTLSTSIASPPRNHPLIFLQALALITLFFSQVQIFSHIRSTYLTPRSPKSSLSQLSDLPPTDILGALCALGLGCLTWGIPSHSLSPFLVRSFLVWMGWVGVSFAATMIQASSPPCLSHPPTSSISHKASSTSTAAASYVNEVEQQPQQRQHVSLAHNLVKDSAVYERESMNASSNASHRNLFKISEGEWGGSVFSSSVSANLASSAQHPPLPQGALSSPHPSQSFFNRNMQSCDDAMLFRRRKPEELNLEDSAAFPSLAEDALFPPPSTAPAASFKMVDNKMAHFLARRDFEPLTSPSLTGGSSTKAEYEPIGTSLLSSSRGGAVSADCLPSIPTISTSPSWHFPSSGKSRQAISFLIPCDAFGLTVTGSSSCGSVTAATPTLTATTAATTTSLASRCFPFSMMSPSQPEECFFTKHPYTTPTACDNPTQQLQCTDSSIPLQRLQQQGDSGVVCVQSPRKREWKKRFACSPEELARLERYERDQQERRNRLSAEASSSPSSYCDLRSPLQTCSAAMNSDGYTSKESSSPLPTVVTRDDGGAVMDPDIANLHRRIEEMSQLLKEYLENPPTWGNSPGIPSMKEVESASIATLSAPGYGGRAEGEGGGVWDTPLPGIGELSENPTQTTPLLVRGAEGAATIQCTPQRIYSPWHTSELI